MHPFTHANHTHPVVGHCFPLSLSLHNDARLATNMPPYTLTWSHSLYSSNNPLVLINHDKVTDRTATTQPS